MFVQIPGGAHLRSRRSGDLRRADAVRLPAAAPHRGLRTAPLLAASIFLDVLNVFLVFLSVFGRDEWRGQGHDQWLPRVRRIPVIARAESTFTSQRQSNRRAMSPLGALARGATTSALGTLAMDSLWYRRCKREGGESGFGAWEFSAGLDSWDAAPAPARAASASPKFCTAASFHRRPRGCSTTSRTGRSKGDLSSRASSSPRTRTSRRSRTSSHGDRPLPFADPGQDHSCGRLSFASSYEPVGGFGSGLYTR